ncbi:MAG: UDP-N-acetylmuramoyl-L-alanyl-D-glutamate--2,6-diaminopimelate ligase [Rickettsiales bacterium]|nr:UDP-N-acetylmuramoyl-L-alanyl-D-glutamate--2,6-diaminopimelate ligase [Rickettsiales bacterium]
MQANKLFKGIANVQATGAGSALKITGIALDSRRCRKGSLFIALPGQKTDGQSFITDALNRGAVAILTDETLRFPLPEAKNDYAVFRHPDPQQICGEIAARFFSPQPRHIAAVTGTNGKTSVAHFCRELWQLMGMESASIGTLGVIHGNKAPEETGLTSPDVVTLHASLKRLAKEKVSHVCLEASSHGLYQHRLNGVKLEAAAFTNLSHDHLDYHGTVEAYLSAKLMLFKELLPEGAPAILNADDPVFPQVKDACVQRGQQVIGYGISGQEVCLHSVVPQAEGQAIDGQFFGQKFSTTIPLYGAFQAMNLLCAAALVRSMGVMSEGILPLLAQVRSVPGRMERVALHPSGAPVIVDYAHTPDGLEKALVAMRPYATGRLVVVFGCGGDRDATKRPEMGKIAARLANQVIVTDDNPRHEEASQIRQQIMAACPDANEIGDRREAIAHALTGLQKEDVLLVAGKGHERGQIIGDTVHPFKDAGVIQEMLACI